MNAYLINTRTLTVLGRFGSVENAEAVAETCTADPYYIATDEGDLGNFKLTELRDLYNNQLGAELKKFGSMAEAKRRVFKVLEDAELADMLPTKAEKPKKAARVPIGKGYRGHRKGCRKETAHRVFDEMFDANRERGEIIAALEAVGIVPSTARSWYQAFRVTSLKERAAKATGNDNA